MKKLALALVCLVSVAFFASCDPENVIENPEPSIAVLGGEGYENYLADGDVIDLNVEYPYGFRVASNAETQEELARLVILITGEKMQETVLCDSVISGTEFVFSGNIVIEPEEREIIGSAEIIATVTDAAGKTNKASIKLDLNEDDSLETTTFEWIRANGADGTGLAEFGLQWTRNVSSRFDAVIEPITNERVTMYSVPAEKWDEVVTATDKAALFSDGGVAEVIQDYRGISVDATHDYDVVIATLYNEEYHLIHITKCIVEERYYVFTITGEAK